MIVILPILRVSDLVVTADSFWPNTGRASIAKRVMITRFFIRSILIIRIFLAEEISSDYPLGLF